MKTLTLNHFVDPGHSWIEIHKESVANLIGSEWRREFTSFSHENGDFVYLEEDEDAETLKKILEQHNYELYLKMHESNELSCIRDYPRFQPTHHD